MLVNGSRRNSGLSLDVLASLLCKHVKSPLVFRLGGKMLHLTSCIRARLI